MKVNVTISVRGKTVAADKVADPNAGLSLKRAGDELGKKLAPLVCPVHQKGVSDVRLHFDAKGVGDVRFEMCCEELGNLASKVL